MEQKKFVQMVETAHTLGIKTLYRYQGTTAMLTAIANTEEGKYRRNMERMHLKAAYSDAIMNSRDERVRMQRALIRWMEAEVWEPDTFATVAPDIIAALKEEIAKHRETESLYIKAKSELYL